ncbi:hypothetical protein [Candidatus Rhabdochlamydia porcellionis]|jgi:hypothetical protein|uniref:Uncharacterized protein n=1 Tax=Candidatus Rhabdochlamydia porcellionis TaxID=225148 RepID=A0ABX8YZ57_9BACT|nr:hypothetical protein [Candidatus Rhabdochlamydia porcellionis]QZA58572.1 hypothetical protein RHAB15C_0000448 [Candidatus Rhabdochlamydia porcellionis]
MTITYSNFPNHPVLLHSKEELHKNPANFENKKKLYYLAATVSSLVATAFFLSFIPLQTMMLPFWLSLAGTITAQSAGGLLVKIAGNMIQNAQEAGKVSSGLREMQSIYQIYQETSLSESEKVIIPHCLLAKKEYIEVEAHLQELIQDTNLSNPKSRLEEIIQLQHQVLLLKIDLCFKVALFDTVAAGNLSYLIEKKDLLTISNQAPLQRNQIQGLNATFSTKFRIEPLIYFRNASEALFGDSANLNYDTVAKMSLESLRHHISTLILYQVNPLSNQSIAQPEKF